MNINISQYMTLKSVKIQYFQHCCVKQNYSHDLLISMHVVMQGNVCIDSSELTKKPKVCGFKPLLFSIIEVLFQLLRVFLHSI